MCNPIKILLVENQPEVRTVLKDSIEEYPDFMVSQVAESPFQIFSKLTYETDVIISDLPMSEKEGYILARTIKSEFPKVKMLILTLLDHPYYIRKALNAGASGYLKKNKSPREMAYAIKHIHQGNIYVSPEITANHARFKSLYTFHTKTELITV
ncbi:MAG: response regulator transcription factor [Sphingobacteriales bacterium]|nr:response regulator transcription factor [Sphingobacteriales bacterium]